MRASPISYRPVVLAIGALTALALAAVNLWAGTALLAVTVLALAWQLLGTLDAPRGVSTAPTLDPLSARDYADLRRRYLHD